MNNSLLWFDRDPKRNLNAKIARAATWYFGDRSVVPTVCYVHPSMVEESERDKILELPMKLIVDTEREVDFTIVVKTTNAVLCDHFWLGIE